MELPAGWSTLGVNSDDGFRMEGGYITTTNKVLLGEFDGARGAADTTFDVFVQAAGVYPVRVIYVEGGTDSNIELFSVKADGTKVLINDTDNGGLRAFRTGTVPTKPTNPVITGIRRNANGSITLEWTGGGTLQAAPTVAGPWQDVTATSPYTFTPAANAPMLFGRIRQ